MVHLRFQVGLASALAGLLVGCLGIEIGNPDGKSPDDPGGGGNGGAPPALRVSHELLRLPPMCRGGASRAGFVLHNDGERGETVTAETFAGEEVHPSIARVESGSSVGMGLVVFGSPGDPPGTRSGEVRLTPEREAPLALAWEVTVRDDALPAPRALCGAEAPCAALDFGPVAAGAEAARDLDVVNDGCAALELTELSSGGRLRVEGPTLPVALAPGERWRGRVAFVAEHAAGESGRLLVRTTAGDLDVPWSAAAR